MASVPESLAARSEVLDGVGVVGVGVLFLETRTSEMLLSRPRHLLQEAVVEGLQRRTRCQAEVNVELCISLGFGLVHLFGLWI